MRAVFLFLTIVGFQINLLAQPVLPDSQVTVQYDNANLIQIHIHPDYPQPTDRPAIYPPLDIFMTTNPAAAISGLDGTNWIWIHRTAFGETNLVLTNTWHIKPFFLVGTLLDSDNDLLTDAYEITVSHTDPTKWDSTGSGVSDGDKLSPNKIPWHTEQAILSSVAIYANLPVAKLGGECGECTVYLPQSAPEGGTTVHYRSGGSAVLGEDFTVSPSGDRNFSNQTLTIPAGQRSGVINICAGPDNQYSPIRLSADLTLTSASNFNVDGAPAEISIIKTGLPRISVFAFPPWLHRPCPTYGTNDAGFYFVRGGESTEPLTIKLSTTGSTAVAGRDYIRLPSAIKFPPNVRTNWLPLSILPNNTDPDDKKLVLTITHAPGYLLDQTNSMSTITIAATPAILTPRP